MQSRISANFVTITDMLLISIGRTPFVYCNQVTLYISDEILSAED